MKIELLNHAAIVIECGPVRLLCDPWFSGTCFEQGWGLKYHNPQCFEIAGNCTHLWVSHFHGDHFHAATLGELFKINPEIIVLGNHSFNFQLDNALKKFGFANVVSLLEREKTQIAEGITITRYPTTGIDNMLLVEGGDIKLLNYNDCNLPVKAIKSLVKKIGRVDILLNNYNHAGKLLSYPLPSASEIKNELKTDYLRKSILFSPRFIIPFASDHYYRAAESQEQNDSLMTVDEISDLDPRIIPLTTGETAEFDDQLKLTHHISAVNISKNKREIVERNRPRTFEELSKVFDNYAARMRKSFVYLTFWLPELFVEIPDLGLLVAVSINRELRIVDRPHSHHISATSEALYSWFSKPYGIDGFWVGAHFEISQTSIVPLRWQLLIGLLTENKLDLLSMIKLIFSVGGLKFLWARREEIVAIASNLTFKVGQR